MYVCPVAILLAVMYAQLLSSILALHMHARTQAGLESSIASLSSPLGQFREELLVRVSCIVRVRVALR